MPQALLERGQPLLELRGVEKSFGAVRALAGVDLTVQSGMVTALCGDNGAGKSVTIKIISGILTPDDGEILWRGNPVHIHSPRTPLRSVLRRFIRTWRCATTWTSSRTCSSGGS